MPMPRALQFGMFVATVAFTVSGPGPVFAGSEEPLCISDVDGQVKTSPGDCPVFATTPLRPASGRSSSRPQGSGDFDSRSAASDGTAYRRAASLPGNESRSPSRSYGESSHDAMSARLLHIATGTDEQASMADFEELVAMGEPVVGSIIRVYRDQNGDPRARWVAGRALGRIPSQASSDALINGLKDAQPMARVAAARGLQDLGERRAVPALVKALNDPGAIVRAAVLDTLGTLGSSAEARPVAAQLTASSNFIKGRGLFVRAHAATALGRLGGSEAVSALIDVVDDRDEDTRTAARSALLAMSGRSTAPSGSGSEKDRWRAWASQH